MNHHKNHQEPSEGVTDEKPVFVLPEEIPSDLWRQFEAHRKRIKQPLSDRARVTAANKLLELARQGHSMRKLMEETELNNWKTFFPTKSGYGKPPHKPAGTGAIIV